MQYETLKLKHVDSASWITLDRPPVNAVTVQLRNRTLDMLILGEDLSAEKAMELSLVTRVVADDSFDAEVAKVATRVASGAPITFRAIKETVRAQYWDSPPAAQALETRWAELNDASQDCQEGKAAFREKRTPVFKGL